MATYSSIKQSVLEATNIARVIATNYNSVDSLPTSGNAVGEQALVLGDSSTDRLYIWEGSAWYQIALIQNSPTFTTSPDDTYELATDGATTTVITLAATDPEGFPVTFSAVTNVGFDSIATVSQDSSVFTVTPFSQDSAGVSRTGTITFKASDGISVASAISTFTITFKIVHSNHTSMLLKASGNNGVNTAINDASSNTHTITRNGNAVAQAFTPYHPAGYDFKVVGNTDAIAIDSGYFTTNNTWWKSSGFTIEGWVNLTSTDNTAIFDNRTSGTSGFLLNYNNTSGKISIYANGGWAGAFSSNLPRDGKWHYIALTVSGTNANLYTDGFKDTTTLTVADTSTYQYFGKSQNTLGAVQYTPRQSNACEGLYRDFKFTAGVQYTGSNMTVPGSRLSSDADTALFVAMLPNPTDISSNASTVSVLGNTFKIVISENNPYDHTQYNPSSHGASVYFDGSGDFLSIGDTATTEFGSGDFTLEMWYNGTDTDQYATLTAKGAGSFSSGNWSLMMNHSVTGDIALYVANYSTSAPMLITGNVNISDGNWNHIAVVRYGNFWNLYVNGVSKANRTSSITIADTTSGVYIGKDQYYGRDLSGFISDYRIVKGTAVYTTSNFAPPTTPLTAISGTSYLTCNDTPNIYNAAGSSNVITLGGDAKSSTAQTKYADASILLDGSGDFITIGDGTNLDFGSKPFTMEGWYRADTTSGDHYIISSSGGTYNAGPSHFGVNIYQGNWRVGGFNDKLIGGVGSGVNTGIDTNTWHHFAWTHNNRKIQFFIDGAQVGSTVDVSADTFDCGGSFQIGGYHSNTGYGNWDGYLEDLRITKGLCRYPFIPFSETLTNNSDTTALLCHADTIVDGSSSAASITTSGDPTVSNFGPHPGMKSVYFDGNDYFNLETTALGSGDFTVEGWIYSDDFGDGSYQQIFSFRPSTGANASEGSMGLNPSGGLAWWTNTFIIGSSNNTPHLQDRTWNHFALVRDNGTLKLFINGTLTNSVANTQNLSEASLSLAANNNGSDAYTGYISNFRILSTVQYTNSFTPPAAELKA